MFGRINKTYNCCVALLFICSPRKRCVWVGWNNRSTWPTWQFSTCGRVFWVNEPVFCTSLSVQCLLKSITWDNWTIWRDGWIKRLTVWPAFTPGASTRVRGKVNTHIAPSAQYSVPPAPSCILRGLLLKGTTGRWREGKGEGEGRVGHLQLRILDTAVDEKLEGRRAGRGASVVSPRHFFFPL